MATRLRIWNSFKKGNYTVPLSILVVLLLPIMLLSPLFLTHTISYRADTWFHMMRIYEMRRSIEDGSLMGTLGNIFTFGQAGQAINGMYPSATLKILVLVTNYLSPVNQVYAIFVLILWLTGLSNLYVFKQLKINSFQLLLASLTMTYVLSLYLILKSGTLGLAISLGIAPIIFYGLVLIQSDEKNKQMQASYLIGIGVGLIFLSHLISAFLSVLIVMIAAVIDICNSRSNFVFYVKSGLVSLLIGLPTIVTTLLLGRDALSVASFGRTPGSIVRFFSPLWDTTQGSAYVGWTLLTVIAVIYIGISLFKVERYRALKIVAILTMLMGTNVAYSKFLDFIQIPERFWILGSLLCVFILIVELFKNPKYGKTIAIIAAGLTMISATNIVYNAKGTLAKQTIWQQTAQVYDRNNTKVNNKTYSYPKFTNLRTYVDYMPREQGKTAIKPPRASDPSKEMLDVSKVKSVRKSGFDVDSIAPGQNKNTASVRQAYDIRAHRNTLSLKARVSKPDLYDLPFWFYKHNGYVVKVNNKLVSPRDSQQGRMSVRLESGINQVSIKQIMPLQIVISYCLSIIALFISIYLLTWLKRSKKLQS
ncbi:hypothetical protein [Pediococcus acidilactici]|uniref:hypothetical protein n=1 Tax=Pediococcus acidilactici TaxID=1254 RepID=UPI0038575A40